MNSSTYKEYFKKPPVICLSVSSSKVYHRTENQHPVLGVEYLQDEYSLTDEYFKKMGMKVRYFMPPNSAAPLAFYFTGDLLGDYTTRADRHHQHDGYLPEDLSARDLQREFRGGEILSAQPEAPGLFADPHRL